MSKDTDYLWEPYCAKGVTLKLADFEFARFDVGLRRVGIATVEKELTKNGKGGKITVEARGLSKKGEGPKEAYYRVRDIVNELLTEEICTVAGRDTAVEFGLALKEQDEGE